MRAILQRVKHASVTTNGNEIAKIGLGILTLLGIERDDSEEQLAKMMTKIISLRIFPDQERRMNLSLREVQGEHLIVPQFTLAGDCRKGHRPSFDRAAPPDQAEAYFRLALHLSSEMGIATQGGSFQTHMQVFLENDGPATFVLDF